MHVGAETLVHVDVESEEYFGQLEEQMDEYPKGLVDTNDTAWDYEESMQEMNENDFWQPFSSLEPVLDAATLERMDQYADQVEIGRLLEMAVI